eukprot:CAMPEP_0197653916 /NCGR_PEP_ID=MMETSP1338-20131121/37692_1 /TAXON_ID=43686 ORGANISM="Pelagodinium beii, Strain RCC1491" /NCGR_SAMPLE_ID=MMETSP1338 /ASSEMBLY_ACC=CAM_ASM_000754 /LENGTH=48 /DNA_ID= /DNA_START= /DNA_END= /DNA_ORIENTATION=
MTHHPRLVQAPWPPLVALPLAVTQASLNVQATLRYLGLYLDSDACSYS